MEAKEYIMLIVFISMCLGLFKPFKQAFIRMGDGRPWSKIPVSNRLSFVRVYFLVIILFSAILTAVISSVKV